MDKLTKQEYKSAIEYKEINNSIEEKVNKYRNQLWYEVDNLDYLDSCNYKYERYKSILISGYSKSILIGFPIISIFILSILSWSINTYGFSDNNKSGIFFWAIAIIWCCAIFICEVIDYKKYKEVKKNFEEL